MNPWETYEARVDAVGRTKRDITFRREQRFLNMKMPTSLSYHALTIDGEPRELAVINSDNLNMKMLHSLPGEDLPHGGLVEWMDNHWLIIEKDVNNELYTTAKMQQCNYLLKWIEDGNIIERWCIVEDGTKYLTGEYGDNNFVLLRGDSRVSVTIARDEHTAILNRESRFLIDDPDSEDVLAYRLTKPFKLSNTFNNEGVYKFVLTECNTEDTDNTELLIADYYKYFPRDTEGGNPSPAPPPDDTQPGKKVWL